VALHQTWIGFDSHFFPLCAMTPNPHKATARCGRFVQLLIAIVTPQVYNCDKLTLVLVGPQARNPAHALPSS